ASVRSASSAEASSACASCVQGSSGVPSSVEGASAGAAAGSRSGAGSGAGSGGGVWLGFGLRLRHRLERGLRRGCWLGIRFRCGCGLGPTRPQQRGRNGDPADAGVSGPFDAVTGTVRVVGPRDVRGTGLLLVAVRAEPLPVVRAGGPAAG